MNRLPFLLLDSHAAWQNANRLVLANREVIVAIAGVFFLLPSLVAAFFLPTPPDPAHMSAEQLLDAMQGYYARSLPLILPLSLLQMAGMITLLTVLLDRRRPTVGEAIRRGLGLVPIYLATQLIVAVAMMLVGGVVLGMLGLALPPVAAGALTVAAMLYPALRTVLVGPVLASGQAPGPASAIRASVTLTRGNAARMLGFLALAGVLFGVVYTLVMILAGTIAGMALTAFGAGANGQELVSATVSAALLAVGYTWFVAMLAAMYAQLARPITDSAA